MGPNPTFGSDLKRDIKYDILLDTLMSSHIRRHIEQQSKRTMYVSMLGSVLVIIFLVIYGIPLLTSFAVFISHGKQVKNTTDTGSVSYIAAPFLNDTFTATNSASITVSGNALKNQDIKLYVNGNYVTDTIADAFGAFTFDNVQLALGDNDIKAKAIDSNNKESDYSNILTITYVNKGPNLNISSPSDNQTISGGNKSIVVQGKTDTSAKVTVNGFWAIVDDQGNFSYTLPLQNGNNQISIVATDNAGNTTTVQKSVTYNP